MSDQYQGCACPGCRPYAHPANITINVGGVAGIDRDALAKAVADGLAAARGECRCAENVERFVIDGCTCGPRYE